MDSEGIKAVENLVSAARAARDVLASIDTVATDGLQSRLSHAINDAETCLINWTSLDSVGSVK